MSAPGILYGPRLRETAYNLQQKRLPWTLPLSCRVQADLLGKVDNLAAHLGVGRSDILRSAVIDFLSKFPSSAAVDSPPQFSARPSPRQDALNRGMIAHTSAPKRQPDPPQNQSGDILDHNPQTNSQTSARTTPAKGKGMKDTIKVF